MEPTEVLRAAMAAVAEAGIAEQLQPVALAKAIDLIAAGGGPARPPAGGDDGRIDVHDDGGRAIGDRYRAIAKELEVQPELVERLFDEHDGQLQFVGNLEKLGTSKQTKVEKMSILLCGARQSGGYDEDGRTPDSAVRAEVDRLGLYDVNNYAKHMKLLSRLANVNGSGKSAVYKMKYEGRVEARAIAATLVGS